MNVKTKQGSAASEAPRAAGSMSDRQRQQGLIVIVGIVVVAIVVFLVAILASGNSNVQEIDYTAMNATRGADGAFIIGNPEAPITVVEFADFGCPHCQTYHVEMQQLVQEYVATGKARFEFRIFPTAGGQQTVYAGAVAECIAEQNPTLFWTAYDRFFELASTGRYFQDGAVIGVVQELGLSRSEVLDCTSDSDQVSIDVNVGTNLGVTGTPAVMVRYGDGPAQWVSYNGTTYDRGSVPYSVLGAVIEQANAS